MSGGVEETEPAVESKLGKKLLELGVPKEILPQVCSVMNEACLEKMRKWKRKSHEKKSSR
jgi:transposase-like protein